MFTAKLTSNHNSNVSNTVQTLSLSRKSGSPGGSKMILQLNYRITNNNNLAFGRVGPKTKTHSRFAWQQKRERIRSWVFMIYRIMRPIWIYALFTALSAYAHVYNLRPDSCISRWLHKIISVVLYPFPPTKFTVYPALLPRHHVYYTSLYHATIQPLGQL